MRYVWRVGTYGYSMKSFIGSISFLCHICGTITWPIFFSFTQPEDFPACIIRSQPSISGSKKSQLLQSRGEVQKEETIFPNNFHNYMVVLAEFSIKDSNFSTKR